ncbi:hypothetical protein AAZX31_13G349300 [Glycine max]|nr:transcription factor bHLH25-like isoform X1 [Glycine max]KAG4972665.1 hypothetical protein JHK85_039086 [Glycine max]KAH1105308.1 hypothetical protein GYH30_038527 [Glycine max]KRH23622.1 hypothetical protein GLYMA_13G368500v4 [Glycine max]
MDDEDVNESLRETNQFDEEFLRDILQQPEEGGEDLKNSSIMSSLFPTTYILSFDKSAAELLPTETDHRDYSSSQLPSSSNSRANHGTNKKPRSASESLDHIMSERNRRQELTSKFIALAATIPGLKKMDKAHVLREAINYVKQLQERIEELEEDIRKNGVESAITIIRSHLCIDDDSNTDEECYGPNEALPEVEARVLGKEVLIKIYCGKQKGILLKIMSQLERLHLYISTSNVLPFGNTLDITITAQMGDKYNLVVNDLVKELRQVAMMKSCDVQQ